MTLWKASSDDVWYTGDNLHMSLQSWEFVNKAESFSLALNLKEHKQQQQQQKNM